MTSPGSTDGAQPQPGSRRQWALGSGGSAGPEGPPRRARPCPSPRDLTAEGPAPTLPSGRPPELSALLGAPRRGPRLLCPFPQGHGHLFSQVAGESAAREIAEPTRLPDKLTPPKSPGESWGPGAGAPRGVGRTLAGQLSPRPVPWGARPRAPPRPVVAWR